MTSAVTAMPRSLAQRSTSTVSAVDTWHTCSRERVSSASWTSRATMPASATAGQPGSPSRPETGPSSQQASRPASRGSWACWATTPSNARTYSSARRISRPSATQCPSSEKTRVRAADRAIRPSSASSSPARPLLTAPIGTTCADPVAAADVEQVLGGLGGVGDRGGVGHGQDGGEAAPGRGRGAGRHRLGVLPARLAQVGVQVDQPGQRDQPVPRRRGTASAPASARVGEPPVADQQVGRHRHRPGRRPSTRTSVLVGGAHRTAPLSSAPPSSW